MKVFQHTLIALTVPFVLALLLLCNATRAGELPPGAVVLHIKAQPLEDALNEFARQTGLQLLISSEDAANGIQAPSIVGTFTPQAALQQLLAQSGLRYEFVNAHTVAIRPMKSETSEPAKPVVDASPSTSSSETRDSTAPAAQGEARKGFWSRLSDAPEASSARQADQTPHKNSDQLEEVIVTAQRREERLQDVPISISALSADAIQTRNLSNIASLGSYVPNLQFAQTNYTTGRTISIRGGVEINSALYFEDAVGIYIDGVYVGKAQGDTFDRPDLERVEVLRGPQGTLYGRNTFSGAINLISAKPTGEWGGDVKVGAGNYGSQRALFNLNLPQFGDFKVRLSGLYDKHNGYENVRANPYPNVAQAKPPANGTLDAVNNKAARIAVRYEPAPELTVDYAFDWSRTNNLPKGSQFVSYAKFPLTGALFDPKSPAYAGALIGGVYRGFPANLYVLPNYTGSVYDSGSINNTPLYERDRVYGHSLTGAWQIGDLTLKSITGVRRLDFGNRFDLDGTPLPIVAGELISKLNTVSQEFQAVGSAGAWAYTAGLYYYRERAEVDNRNQFFGNATTGDLAYNFGTDAYAAYGQVDYHLTDPITLTGGLRYSSERKTMDAALSSIATASGLITTVFPSTSRFTDSHAITPTAIFKYTFNPDANVYFKYARGFKSGGFSLGSMAVFAVIPYAPETADTYEIGTKLRFLDDTLQINAAAYYNKVHDLQVSVFLSSGVFATSVVQNAAQATIEGGELEVEFAPVDWLKFRSALGYINPRYSSYINDGVNIADTRVFPVSPKFTYNAGADAELWRSSLTNVHFVLDYSHSDPYYTLNFDRRPLSQAVRSSAQPTVAQALNLVNATLRLADIAWGAGEVEFSLWSQNLFNTHRRLGGVDFGSAFGNLTYEFFNDPRTFGADVYYKF